MGQMRTSLTLKIDLIAPWQNLIASTLPSSSHDFPHYRVLDGNGERKNLPQEKGDVLLWDPLNGFPKSSCQQNNFILLPEPHCEVQLVPWNHPYRHVRANGFQRSNRGLEIKKLQTILPQEQWGNPDGKVGRLEARLAQTQRAPQSHHRKVGTKSV